MAKPRASKVAKVNVSQSVGFSGIRARMPARKKSVRARRQVKAMSAGPQPAKAPSLANGAAAVKTPGKPQVKAAPAFRKKGNVTSGHGFRTPAGASGGRATYRADKDTLAGARKATMHLAKTKLAVKTAFVGGAGSNTQIQSRRGQGIVSSKNMASARKNYGGALTKGGGLARPKPPQMPVKAPERQETRPQRPQTKLRPAALGAGSVRGKR